MNRRANLLTEETLKIVIALISIGFLVYFLTALYFRNSADKDLELAESSLEHLVEAINSDVKEVEIYNPKGWCIVTWPYEKNEKPKLCEDNKWDNCICICECKSLVTDFQDYADEYCGVNGVCLKSNNLFYLKNKIPRSFYIEINNPPLTLQIKDNVILEKPKK